MTVMQFPARTYTKQEDQIDTMKGFGGLFIVSLHNLGGTDSTGEKFGSPELTLAAAKIEQAVKLAIEHITK